MQTIDAIKLKEEIVKKTSKEYLQDRDGYLKKLEEIRKKYSKRVKKQVN